MFSALALLLQAAVPIPPVDLNHFYVTLDRKTFDAIRQSKWLRENFANVNVSTHSSGEDTWTGIYVYGVGSYVEIFAADEQHREGTGGVGFLTTSAGGADNVFYHFRRSPFGPRAERDLMMLGSGTKQAPFAHIVSYSGQERTNLNVWLMEYHANYYEKAGVPVGSSEAQIFSAYNLKSSIEYTGMMGDLCGLTLRPNSDGNDVQAALGLFGFQPAEGRTIWRRGRNEVAVLPPLTSNPKYAVTSARFSLRQKPKSPHIERFGARSQLRVSPDGSAEWRFL